MSDFAELQGKFIKEVQVDREENEIYFLTECGQKYKMFHEQECCESVIIQDICNNLQELVDQQILLAEERTQTKEEDEEFGDSHTWTFYTIRTLLGTYDIRWHGTSNGYYSESVEFVRLDCEENNNV